VGQLEIGAQGGQVVILVTVRTGADEAEVLRLPLTADEARELVNGIGEAVLFLARAGTP
jgi:hypothetical protein